MGEDMVVGLVGAGMGALITYFYLKNLPSSTTAVTTTGTTGA
jgi:hypothetical protein